MGTGIVLRSGGMAAAPSDSGNPGVKSRDGLTSICFSRKVPPLIAGRIRGGFKAAFASVIKIGPRQPRFSNFVGIEPGKTYIVDQAEYSRFSPLHPREEYSMRSKPGA